MEAFRRYRRRIIYWVPIIRLKVRVCHFTSCDRDILHLIFYVYLFTFESMESAANETKIIYYVDDEPIPYRIRISVDPQAITLADIKSVLLRTNCKYFFKSLDADFGYSTFCVSLTVVLD